MTDAIPEDLHDDLLRLHHERAKQPFAGLAWRVRALDNVLKAMDKAGDVEKGSALEKAARRMRLEYANYDTAVLEFARRALAVAEAHRAVMDALPPEVSRDVEVGYARRAFTDELLKQPPKPRVVLPN